jgi:hypothetical protein
LGELSGDRFFVPCPLELREMTYEWREAGFMVFTVEPSPVPSTERRLHLKTNKTTIRTSLKTNAIDNLSVDGAGLVFQEDVIFE